MNKILIVLCCMCLIGACSLPSVKTEDDNFSPIWEHDFEVGYFSSINPLLYQDLVIFSGLDERKTDFSANSTLEAFRKKNGETVWVWSDNFLPTGEQFKSTNSYHVDDNLLFISTRWDYIINIENGRTVSASNQNKLDGVDYYGTQNRLFTSFISLDQSLSTVEYTALKEFDWRVLLSRENSDTAIYYFKYFLFDPIVPEQIYIPYTKWNGEKSRPNIMLYDLSKDKIIVDKELDVVNRSLFIDYKPILEGGNLFFSIHGQVARVQSKNFETIWQRRVEGNSSRSGIMYSDGVLYVNTEFQLYALDAETGRIIWQIDSSAGSRMIEDDGIVYYTDGIHLRGVDALTGEVLLEEDAPSYATDEGAFFQPVLTIDHENDRIYTASYTHAYCYPTLR